MCYYLPSSCLAPTNDIACMVCILQEYALLQGKDVTVDGMAVTLPYMDNGVLVKSAGRYVVMSLTVIILTGKELYRCRQTKSK